MTLVVFWIGQVLLIASPAVAHLGWRREARLLDALLEENAALYRMLQAKTNEDLLEAATAIQCAQDKQRRALGRKQ